MKINIGIAYLLTVVVICSSLSWLAADGRWNKYDECVMRYSQASSTVKEFHSSNGHTLETECGGFAPSGLRWTR